MKFSVANTDCLYPNVIKTIIELMLANNVRKIDMTKDKTFGKHYLDLHLTEDNQLAYNWECGDKIYEMIFKIPNETWYHTIHRFDLPHLLLSVVYWINDNVTEEY